MKTEEVLFEKYGPLVPLSGLALMLDRSPSATRMFLLSQANLACQLRSVRVKIGRRIYFRTSDVAKIFGCDEGRNMENDILQEEAMIEGKMDCIFVTLQRYIIKSGRIDHG